MNHKRQNLTTRIISYRDLLSSEIFEDGTTITKTVRSGQVGGALIGAIALGAVWEIKRADLEERAASANDYRNLRQLLLPTNSRSLQNFATLEY